MGRVLHHHWFSGCGPRPADVPRDTLRRHRRRCSPRLGLRLRALLRRRPGRCRKVHRRRDVQEAYRGSEGGQGVRDIFVGVARSVDPFWDGGNVGPRFAGWLVVDLAAGMESCHGLTLKFQLLLYCTASLRHLSIFSFFPYIFICNVGKHHPVPRRTHFPIHFLPSPSPAVITEYIT